MQSVKLCAGCNCEKPLEAFYVQKTARDGRQGRCKVCWAERTKAWVAANPERYREKMLARVKAYQARNAEKVRERERAKYASDLQAGRERVRQKRKSNPACYAANNAARYGQKRKAVPSWANREEIRSIYRKAAEMTATTGIKHHVDHVVPLRSKRVCGLHVQHNLAVIPSAENIRKGNRFWPDMP